jgi:signal transduction histidine kinase
VVARYEAERAQAGSALRLDVESAVGRWSRTRLDQVIGNLLRNAIKYGRHELARVDRVGRFGQLCAAHLCAEIS